MPLKLSPLTPMTSYRTRGPALIWGTRIALITA